MMTGKGKVLQSQFRVTFNMILNILQLQDFEVLFLFLDLFLAL